jgi:hypothetical protein
MTSSRSSVDRRVLLSSLALLPAFPGILASPARTELAQQSPTALASWNEGPVKQAIIDFVQATTDRVNLKFVPPEDRIATSIRIARYGSSTLCAFREH